MGENLKLYVGSFVQTAHDCRCWTVLQKRVYNKRNEAEEEMTGMKDQQGWKAAAEKGILLPLAETDGSGLWLAGIVLGVLLALVSFALSNVSALAAVLLAALSPTRWPNRSLTSLK